MTQNYSQQQHLIMEHMRQYGKITSAEAFGRYGITRLSSRISELMQKGIMIDKTPICGKNRYGAPVRYLAYSLREVDVK